MLSKYYNPYGYRSKYNAPSSLYGSTLGYRPKRKYVNSKFRKTKQNQLAKDARRNIVHVLRGPTPTQAFVKLKVTGIVAITINAAGQFNEVNPIGQINDLTVPPFFSQPTGYDQWAAMFQRFTVLAGAVKVCVAQTQSGVCAGNLSSCTVIPSTMTLTQMRTAADSGGGTGTGVNCDLINDRLARTKYFSRNDANAELIEIKHYIKLKTLYPDKDVKDDPDFTGTTSSFQSGAAAPVNDPYWYIYFQTGSTPASGAGDECIFQVRATITYYTLFSSPVNVYDN